MNQLTAAKGRIQSIDVLRGIVMVLMALDHVRDYFHSQAFLGDPLNANTTSPALYFTRWITHFCAPTFVFLAGASAYFTGKRRTKAELSSFLLKRGLWLIVVEVVIMTFALTFNPFFNAIFLQTIWSIGISMIILGLLVRLPYKVIVTLGLLIVLGHNLLDYPEAARNNDVGFLWDLLHNGRFDRYALGPNHSLFIVYAFLPWTGIMLMGYCAGRLYEPAMDAAKRKKILVSVGAGLILLFFLLRWINAYGNPFPWTPQSTPLKTFYSFMNVLKYPPSLMYTCATIGPALIVLALMENVQNAFTGFVRVFGRVPFFYYVVHFYVIHLFTVVAFYIEGYTNKDIVDPQVPFLFRPLAFGYPLWVVYLIWIGLILLLYPLCRWYDRYKSTHFHWWLSYL
jgi:uncharacterized membrane protein